jgi:hypothetical protein
VIVVHHPRLPLSIGYFPVFYIEPKLGKIPAGARMDFDVVEVYNGYEVHERAKVEVVLGDWFGLLDLGKRMAASGSSDSHKLQFQWAGYPRTYVEVGPKKGGDVGSTIDTAAVVAAVKAGRGFVTSGPILSFDVSGARPGEEMKLRGNTAVAHLKVSAAPWIDVRSIEILAGSGRALFRTTLPAQDAVVGKEEGPLEEAIARSVRFDQTIPLTIPADAKWIVAVVRGDRAYDDVLPFMPVQPMAFTNPVWVVH